MKIYSTCPSFYDLQENIGITLLEKSIDQKFFNVREMTGMLSLQHISVFGRKFHKLQGPNAEKISNWDNRF